MKTPKGFWEGKNYLPLYLFPFLQLIPFIPRQIKLQEVKRNGQTVGLPFLWREKFICFRTAPYQVLEFCLPPGRQVLYPAVIQVSQPLITSSKQLRLQARDTQCWDCWLSSHIGHCCLFPSVCYMQPALTAHDLMVSRGSKVYKELKFTEVGGLHPYSYGRVIVHALVRCFGSVCFEVTNTVVSNPSPMFCMQA